jgi:ATP-dependent protease ClpP protease subunit
VSRNPYYYANPNRAIYIQGPIDQAQLYRVTPEIIKLRAHSRKPVTVYINSNGGYPVYSQAILDLLKSHTQTNDESCRVITVATSQAASAAADLLSAGDYAMAYPECRILYHGVRMPSDKPLTLEESASLSERIRGSNESYAMQLARRADFRAMYRFTSLKDNFDEVRQEHKEIKNLSNLRCLLLYLDDKLSEQAQEIVERARERYGRYNAVLMEVVRNTKRPDQYKTRADFEAAQIKAIIKLEQKRNKKDKDWGFLSDGINNLTDDFLLLHEYLRMLQSERFQTMCLLWSQFWLSDQDREEIEKAPEEQQREMTTERMRPHLLPMWSFFMGLCYVLQYGENALTAEDAFWLGLIDEVVGVKGLPSFRVFAEQAAELAQQEKEEVSAAAGAQVAGAEA